MASMMPNISAPTTTTTAASASTSQQVFDVTELLESILSHLSPTDLAHIRRVERYSNAVILKSGSKRLREARYLEPGPSSTELLYFTPYGDYAKPTVSTDFSKQGPFGFPIARLHPAARSTSSPIESVKNTHNSATHFELDMDTLATWVENYKLDDVLMAQPPFKTFCLTSTWEDEAFESTKGFTFGELAETMEKCESGAAKPEIMVKYVMMEDSRMVKGARERMERLRREMEEVENPKQQGEESSGQT